jgi:hypothetical protein
MSSVVPISAWRLRYDLISVRAMLLLVGGSGRDDLRPEVHLFLADRYDRLAAHLARHGRVARANQLSQKAEWHYAHGGYDDYPRAAAMAMPVPRPRLFTDARAGRFVRRPPDSDDAA